MLLNCIVFKWWFVWLLATECSWHIFVQALDSLAAMAQAWQFIGTPDWMDRMDMAKSRITWSEWLNWLDERHMVRERATGTSPRHCRRGASPWRSTSSQPFAGHPSWLPETSRWWKAVAVHQSIPQPLADPSSAQWARAKPCGCTASAFVWETSPGLRTCGCHMSWSWPWWTRHTRPEAAGQGTVSLCIAGAATDCGCGLLTAQWQGAKEDWGCGEVSAADGIDHARIRRARRSNWTRKRMPAVCTCPHICRIFVAISAWPARKVSVGKGRTNFGWKSG